MHFPHLCAGDQVHLPECTVICGCQQQAPARLMDLQTRQARWSFHPCGALEPLPPLQRFASSPPPPKTLTPRLRKK